MNKQSKQRVALFFGGDMVTRVKDMIRRYRWKQSFRK